MHIKTHTKNISIIQNNHPYLDFKEFERALAYIIMRIQRIINLNALGIDYQILNNIIRKHNRMFLLDAKDSDLAFHVSY